MRPALWSGPGECLATIHFVLELSTDVKFVKGIGPRIAETLAAKDIRTVEDLLYHLPFRYEDRLHPRPIAEIKPGETASTVAEVRGVILLRTKKNMSILEIAVGQGLTSMKCLWFHGQYLKDRFRVGQMLALYGRVEASRSGRGVMKMIQPQFEVLSSAGDAELNTPQDRLLEVGRIVPIYESLGGPKLGPRWAAARHVQDAGRVRQQHCGDAARGAEAKVALAPAPRRCTRCIFRRRIRRRANWLLRLLPRTGGLSFEELFFLELGLELKRRRMREREGVAFNHHARGA
jgi:ATP-dependent DNA helicase RecG